MKWFVKAKPRARKEKVERVSENQLHVWVKEPPEGGRANEAIVRVLAAHFSVPASHVRIVQGQTARMKIVEVTER